MAPSSPAAGASTWARSAATSTWRAGPAPASRRTLDFGWDKGKITVGGHGGIGWGLGGKVGGDFTVDVPELLDTGGDVIDIHRRIPLVNATLPIPVQFELPGPDWAPVDPAASGIENAAFVAARTPISPGYTPTLVISGDERYDDASLRDIAEEAAALLTRETPHLKLLHREEVGSEKAPAITQLIGAGIEVDGQRLDLVQLQVLTAILDVDDPRKRVVVIYKVTCLAPDWPRIGREFQDFMRTVRPAPDQPAVGLLDLPERERDREADHHRQRRPGSPPRGRSSRSGACAP